MQRRLIMVNQNEFLSVSIVRKRYNAFFERVMVLYNLVFFKEEKEHKVDDVKKFSTELYKAGRINDYIKETIDESVVNFALLLPGQIKRGTADLARLDANIILSTNDINAEISELLTDD